MTGMRITAIGVPWYTRENYARILVVMADAHLLPTTFEKWESAAEQLVERVKRQGVVPFKAHIDPETFPGWCRGRGLNVDAEARKQFANTIAAAQIHQGSA